MSLLPETIKALNDQVREIAQHLGMEFDREFSKRQEQIWNYHGEINSGNKRIAFSTLKFNPESALKDNGRFVIRAVFPKDKKGQCQYVGYNVETPKITVAMDRGSKKISRAIKTRLLPEYERQLVIALERIEKSDAYHAGRLQILKTVAEYFGQPAPENDDKAIYPPGGHEKLGLGIYKIEVCSDDQVTFTVTCGVPKALKIFDILKQIIAAAPDLLEACKDLMDNWPAYWIVLPSWPKEYQQRLDVLKAAIAKATEAEGK